MLKNLAKLTVFSLFMTAACIKTPPSINAASDSAAEPQSTIQTPKSEIAVETGAEKPVADNPNAKIFRGLINGTAFEMRLVRDGNKLSGTYFYTKVGKDLNLAGTIDATGKFKLKETDAAGKATGEWSGEWKDDANSNGLMLEGNWKKPGGKDGDSFPFYATEQVIEFTNGTKFTDKTIKENDKTKRSESVSVYPELTGADAAVKFNGVVKNLVTNLNASYQKNVAEFTVEDIKALSPGISLSHEIGYDVALANDEIISLIFSDYTFTGGAHGGTSSLTINYDLKNNRELKLADIFEPDSDYLKVISAYSIADLKKRVTDMSDDQWIGTGAGAVADNFQSWNLTKKGLMFTFDQYQVAAYAAGPQTVIVPYNKLKSILRKDGVIASLAK